MIRIDPGTEVVLDLDDTLYSERDYQESGFRAVAQSAARAEWVQLYELMLTAENPLRAASEASGLPLEELLEVHRTHRPYITLYSDAERLLDRLERPAILTDGRSVTQRNKIAALGIEDRISDVFISEETGFSKPDPGAFQSVVKAPPACYVADNPRKDFVTARRLGWITIMLLDRGYNVHTQDVDLPDEYWPDYRIESLDEIGMG